MPDHRIDIHALKPVHRTPEGYLICDAIVSSVGVFEYRNPDGTVRREARLREDVLDPASLESLAGKPVALLHPRQDDGTPIAVTPDNVAEFQVGTVGTEFVELAGGHVRAQLLIHRRDAIDAIEGRGNMRIRELSPGYGVREDHTPAEFDGERYDLRQRDIRYNHIALVPRGRQGITRLRVDDASVSLRLDADDAVPWPDLPDGGRSPVRIDYHPPQPKGHTMLKFRIDGVEYTTEDASLVEAVQAQKTKLDEAEGKLAVLEKAAEEANTKLDEAVAAKEKAEGELAATSQKLDEATSEEGRRTYAKQRAALEAVAKAVKLDDADVDKLDNADLRRAVVAKHLGKTLDELKDRSDAYFDGVFEAMATSAPAGGRSDDLAGAFRRSDAAPTGNSADYDTRVDAAQGEYLKHLTGADDTTAA